MQRHTLVLAATCVALAFSVFAGDEKGKDKDKPDQRPFGQVPFLATAKTYNMQSHDHARLLGKYAAADASVPANVVKEHADAIRFNVAAEKRSFDRLAKLAAENKDLIQRVERLQKRLDKVNALVGRMENEVEKNSANEKAIISGTRAISEELLQNHREIRTIDNSFYNSGSDSYYETGEGHFVD